MNIVQYAPNLSRAFEIAMAGSHTLGLMLNWEASNITYPEAAKITYLEDVKLIRSYYNLTEQPDYPDMIMELVVPHHTSVFAALFDNRGETLEDIIKRINEYHDFGSPTKPQLHNASRNMLKSAIEKQQLGLRDVDQVLRVSQTIAGLAGCVNEILPEHIAEAIQYKCVSILEYQKYKV